MPFLVTRGGAYNIKERHNYILHPGLKFSDDLDCYGLQNLDKAAKLLRKAENELRGKFFFHQFSSKYNLTSCTYNYAF